MPVLIDTRRSGFTKSIPPTQFTLVLQNSQKKHFYTIRMIELFFVKPVSRSFYAFPLVQPTLLKSTKN